MSKTHLKIVDKFFSWIACYQGNLTKKSNVKDTPKDSRQIFFVDRLLPGKFNKKNRMSKIYFQIVDKFPWWAVDYITKQNLVKL